jgi:hypothetical protein
MMPSLYRVSEDFDVSKDTKVAGVSDSSSGGATLHNNVVDGYLESEEVCVGSGEARHGDIH